MTVYHFVGIKGAGMSALAQILSDMNLKVQGSDVETYYFTQAALESRNIPIYVFDESNIKEGQTIVAGNAFKDDHPELLKAKELGLEIIRYHKFLADMMQDYTSIAVTGCHGKTSTTGLLSHILKGIVPTSYLIGDGTGSGDISAEYLAFEACEYRRHFLAYKPDFCIMTNVDFDHPDYYRDVEDVARAFQEMVANVKRGIFAYGDDINLRNLTGNIPIVYYGFSDENEFQARNVSNTPDGTDFNVFYKGEFVDSFHIPMFGTHNVLNSLVVIAICITEDIDLHKVKANFLTYGGVKRRFTEKEFGSQVLVDDYAHHPTEIIATLDSAKKKYRMKEIVAVFQPHTFSRTKKFISEFAEALSGADKVYLCDIFGSAREQSGDLSIFDLLEKIPGAGLISVDTVEQLKEHEDAVILFMGAGDIQKYQKSYENL